jgi:hypothetical protein
MSAPLYWFWPGELTPASTLVRDGGSCTHSEIVSGEPLFETCSKCAREVIDVDPYCRYAWWDGICVAEAEMMCRLPATEAEVFRWREGAFYGNIFAGFHPDKEQVRVALVGPPGDQVPEVQEEVDGGIWIPGTTNSDSFEGLVFPQMFACWASHWTYQEAYLLRRVCAGPHGAEQCAAAPVGRCSHVCLSPNDGGAVVGDHDYQDCKDLKDNVWMEPVTTVLNAPCDVLGTGSPECFAASWPYSDLDW